MAADPEQTLQLRALPPFKPDLFQRAWCSIPHPTLPLLATPHNKAVTIFSLATLSSHSTLTGGHNRSVRSATWKPGLPPHKLCVVTCSFDSTAALWRWEQNVPFGGDDGADADALEVEITGNAALQRHESDQDGDGWEFELVLEGHENEVKSVVFSPSGQYLATCSRDKSVWIWEDVGANEADDEWETVAVLTEHEGDVKCVAWCPDVPGRSASARYSSEVLASASYDDTVRIWREDDDDEWVCVSVLDNHQGIVWGLQWEPNPKNNRFPRLMTWSADQTIRIWTLRETEGDDDADGEIKEEGGSLFRTGLGGIPNTMRRTLREYWDCTAILPAVHSREIYSATWSSATGLVASTGSDGLIAVYSEYGEARLGENEDTNITDAEAEAEAARELDGEAPATNGHAPQIAGNSNSNPAGSTRWRVLTTMSNGHGPYEINHITWCRRFDAGSEQRGVEEMLVTTGDDGVVRPWQVLSEAA